MENEEYYTAQEIADKLKVNIMTVYRHINSGKLSAIKTGKDFRVLKSDFDSYLKNSQQSSVIDEKEKRILKLSEEIEKLKRNIKSQKYGLVWEDKLEDVVEQCKDELPVLVEVKNKEIIADKDKPTNILIEGDNYHALSVLNYTHAGKIDVIYIDPPYNTGAKDWKYNNNYVDSND